MKSLFNRSPLVWVFGSWMIVSFLLFSISGSASTPIIADSFQPPQWYPKWLLEVGTYHIVAVIMFFASIGGGIGWLVKAHKSPDSYGFGSTKLFENAKENQVSLLLALGCLERLQKETLKRTNQMLFIQLFNARSHTDLDSPFPEWADELLKSGILLDSDSN